mgnify:CR=1 FL=1
MRGTTEPISFHAGKFNSIFHPNRLSDININLRFLLLSYIFIYLYNIYIYIYVYSLTEKEMLPN